MALTQQQLDATRKYKAGEITSDQYKQAYVTNYDPTKDRTAGKNIAYSGISSPEAIKIQENSQALINAMQPKQPVQPVPQIIQPAPQMIQPQVQPKMDYLGAISSQYGEATNMAVAKLKQAIAESKAKQQGIITNAPKLYDKPRAESELAKGQQLRSVLERNSLLGDRGGVGRSAALQTQTSGENRLNSINLQQQEVIDKANAEIANLESRGLYEEANIRSQQKLAELQALMAESQRQDEIARRSQETAETRAYNDSIRGQEYAREDAQTAEERARQDFQSTIMANYNDISALANQLEASGAPQWQIDQARAAVVQKRADLNLDSQGRPIPTAPTVAKLTPSVAMDLWQSLGTSTPAIAQALGVAEGQRYPAQASGSSGSRSTSGSSVTTPAPTSTPKQIISYAESQLRGSGGSSAADKLVTLNNAGVMDNLTPSEIKSLMNKFGVDEKMIEQAENRLESLTTGVKLPSGRVTVPTNPNLLVR